LDPVSYHHPGPEFPEVLSHHLPGLGRVLEAGIGKAGIPSDSQTQNLGSLFRFTRPGLGRPLASHLPPGQVQDTCAFPPVIGLKEGTAAKEFRVVRVGHDGQNVYWFHENLSRFGERSVGAGHSCRRASTGSSLEARMAGSKPKSIPVRRAMARPAATDQKGMAAGIGVAASAM